MRITLLPLRPSYALFVVLISFGLLLPCSEASEDTSRSRQVQSKVGIVNSATDLVLEVTIDGEGPSIIGRGKAETFFLKGQDIMGEHELVAKAYIPSKYFGKCRIGKERTIIFEITDEVMDSPVGKVGWFNTFERGDFAPSTRGFPLESYRKTMPKGLGLGMSIYKKQALGKREEGWETHQIRGLIRWASKEFRIPQSLLTAVIEVESGFKAEAVSHRGALGLMQLMPETCTRFSVQRPFDPQENIEGGAKYLSYLLHQWSSRFPGYQRLELSLAAYNAGEQKVELYGDVPPFKETKEYVREVLKRYKALEEAQTT